MQISTYHTIDEYYSPIPEGKKDKIIHWANGMYALKLSCQLERSFLIQPKWLTLIIPIKRMQIFSVLRQILMLLQV